MSAESIKTLSGALYLVCCRPSMYLVEVSLQNISSYMVGYEHGCGVGYDAGEESFTIKFSQFLNSKYNRNQDNVYWFDIIKEIAFETNINDIELLKLNVAEFIDQLK